MTEGLECQNGKYRVKFKKIYGKSFEKAINKTVYNFQELKNRTKNIFTSIDPDSTLTSPNGLDKRYFGAYFLYKYRSECPTPSSGFSCLITRS